MPLGVMLLLLVGCSSPVSQESVEVSLLYAEASIDNGNPDEALESVEQYADSVLFDQLTVAQLCRLSMVFMQVSDKIDQATNVERATDIYDYVNMMSADSAAVFYDSVEPMQMQFVEAMRHNSVARRAPMDVSSIPADMFFETDSLGYIDTLAVVE